MTSTERPGPGTHIGAMRWAMIGLISLLGLLACNAATVLTTPETNLTATGESFPTEARQEPTASPVQEMNPFPPREPIEMLPDSGERGYRADLSLTFEGQNDSGEPVQAIIDREVVRRDNPHLLFTHSVTEVTGVPGLAPPEAPDGEIVQTVLLVDGTLHVLLESSVVSACSQEQMPDGFSMEAEPDRKGLLQVEQYLRAASKATALSPGEATGVFNNRPADHYEAESALIWSGTRASLEVWVEPDTDWIPSAQLQGEGRLPPYGEGEFRIEISVERLEEDFDVQVPDPCRVQ